MTDLSRLEREVRELRAFEDIKRLKISLTGYRRVINQTLNRRDMPYKMKAPPWAVEGSGAS